MKDLLRKSHFLTFICCIFVRTILEAQQFREIVEPTLGVEFIAPEEWQYQRNEAGYVMGHNSIAGIIIVTTSTLQTLDEMRQGAYEGIQEGEGTLLQLVGELKPIGLNGLAGNFTGTMNWEQVKAYIIGLVNPTGGPSISCMILTSPNMFTDEHTRTLETMAKSFKFSKPKIPDVVQEWDTWFRKPGGCRLKYLSSSGSSDYGGGYTGSSSEETIDLCPNGSFSFSSSSDFSMSIDAGSAFSASNDEGTGHWELKFNGNNPVLVLNFNNNQVSEYELTYVDSKTYLNSSRYFVLFDNEGPGCY